MGLDIFLQDENGNVLKNIGDPHNLLHQLLPSLEDTSYSLLRFVDWYGDTIFNRLQMETFLIEWERLIKKAGVGEEFELLAQIKNLARLCQKTPHLYLKFYGD